MAYANIEDQRAHNKAYSKEYRKSHPKPPRDKEKAKIYDARSRAKHKEERAARRAAKVAANPEKYRAIARESASRNFEKNQPILLQRGRATRAAHPEWTLYNSARARA